MDWLANWFSTLAFWLVKHEHVSVDLEVAL